MKEHALNTIQSEWLQCSRCDLSTTRKGDTCLGTGDIHADFLIVVDTAPLKADRHFPLEGDHAKLILGLLEQAGIDSETCFFTPAVACAPYVEVPDYADPKKLVKTLRNPSAKERDACAPRLAQTIYAVDPRVIFTFGDTAWTSLVGTKARGNYKTAKSAQGVLFDAQIPGVVDPLVYPLMAFIAPKELLANPSTATHAPIARTLQGISRAREYVESLLDYEAEEIGVER